VGEVSKNLISLYQTSKNLNSSIKGSSNVKSALTLGSGIMGGGIAWAFANMNCPVRMKDITNEALALGYEQIKNNFNTLLKRRKITKAEYINKLSLVSATTSNTGFKNADIVCEAVVEDMEVKKKIFKDLENNISKNMIVASNTSALSITEMAKSFKNPERFIGMHFFNPVNRMPLVEIIPHEKTSKSTIDTVSRLVKEMGKTPIVVKDESGFLVNRILLPFINEAFYLLEETGNPFKIDKAIEKYGLPMGPFVLADTVGLDVGYKVAKQLEDSFGKRMKVSPLIDQVYNELKLLGRKSGKGVYDYSKKKAVFNKDVKKLCKPRKNPNEDEIIERLIGVIKAEANLCLQEKIVKSRDELQLAMVLGAGFPPSKSIFV
jgi:3-hydroxyacyl-CoA dehydrogenase/enoyl-CoA hydratase/3-hydroxybutyryl-CoA epimerase